MRRPVVLINFNKRGGVIFTFIRNFAKRNDVFNKRMIYAIVGGARTLA